jgi:hypothetical protein
MIKHVVSLKVGFRSASSHRALDNTPRLDYEQISAVSGFQLLLRERVVGVQ